MSIPLCLWLEKVTLNLYEEMFQRWSYKVAFWSACNEATVELALFSLWRHQSWSCMQHHYCLYKPSCWSSQAFKLHVSIFLGWEDDIVKEHLYYIGFQVTGTIVWFDCSAYMKRPPQPLQSGLLACFLWNLGLTCQQWKLMKIFGLDFVLFNTDSLVLLLQSQCNKV